MMHDADRVALVCLPVDGRLHVCSVGVVWVARGSECCCSESQLFCLVSGPTSAALSSPFHPSCVWYVGKGDAREG